MHSIKNSFENPFAPPEPKNSDDAELVGLMLGDEERKIFEEEFGKGQKAVAAMEEEDEPPVELSEAEKKDLDRIRNERPWTREQLIEWAESMGRDEEWLDRMFNFNPDGTFESITSLYIKDHESTEFPRGWKGVSGNLVLDMPQLRSFNNCPQDIRGNITFRTSNQLESLDGLPPPEMIMGEVGLERE